MSRTRKTDPYRVKVERHGARHWMPIFHCGCASCADPGREPRVERRRGKDQVREWEREYE